jgi:hypothetical protein
LNLVRVAIKSLSAVKMKFKSKVIRFRMCLVSIGGNIPTHKKAKTCYTLGANLVHPERLEYKYPSPSLSLSLKSLQALLCSDPSTFL